MDIFAQRGYLCEKKMLRLRLAEELTCRYGVSVPEIVMRYAFSNEINIFTVVSTTSVKRLQLQMNIHTANNLLSTKDAAYLLGGIDGKSTSIFFLISIASLMFSSLTFNFHEIKENGV